MISRILIFSFILLFACKKKEENKVEPMTVVPTPSQITYQEQELIGFIHFGMNTFTDREWGFGDEDPKLFNPVDLDAHQWAEAARDGGLKELILTAKHHDGFCLWPSKYTEHSVKNSSYKEGKGDIVREFVDACHKYDLKVGLYLSPWDRNHPDYGTPAYLEYYKNQLRELLTEYGDIAEIWFDGANGGDGYYGGANETRQIDAKTYYDWPTIIALVRELQPDCKIFSDAGPDIHWIGNEKGFAGETFWSTIDASKLVIGASDPAYLNTGDPEGNSWIVGQCDVSIRPGWFYHTDQDDKVKSPMEIMNLYNKSVGRNAMLLLNLPPNKQGLLHETDVESLRQFREICQESYAHNYTQSQALEVETNSGSAEAAKLTDGNRQTYWIPEDKETPAEAIVRFDAPISIDRVVLQEAIELGQRISQFTIEIEDEEENWKSVFQGTTIGLKRIAVIDSVHTDAIKVRINQSLDLPLLSEIGFFLSSAEERKAAKFIAKTEQ